MLRFWECAGFKPVQAHTKGEARAKFLQQARELEMLSFHPRRVDRLPAGVEVKCVGGLDKAKPGEDVTAVQVIGGR